MSYDIEKALAYQLKKEIAERYFALRKLIEDDTSNAKMLLERLDNVYKKRIRPAILRIYVLLSDEDLIREFASLSGLKNPLFWEEYLGLSNTEKRQLIEELEPHGWFKESRFLNMLLDSYKQLFREWEQYHELREEVLDELQIVKEEVDQFTRNYSLDEIMQFLRTLDIDNESTSKALGKIVEGRKMGEFDKKLGFSQNIDELFNKIPELDKIPRPESVERQLKDLGKKAYERHGEEFSNLL